MPNTQTMTDEENVDIAYQSCLLKTSPLPPCLAKVIKEKVGLDCLLSLGWNLSEVEANFL